MLLANNFETNKKFEELSKQIENLTQFSVNYHSASEPRDRNVKSKSEDGKILTIVENKTTEKIILRKKSKLGQAYSTTDFIVKNSNDFDEEPSEIFQVNNLTADEVATLRKEELNANDFNLEHLNKTEKDEILKLLMKDFKIKLKDADKQKLAFCSELGNFQPTRLPFGSKNSTSYFHLLISKCLDDLKGSHIQYFLDDVIIAADSISEMNTRLQQVFDRLAKFNLTLDPNKVQISDQSHIRQADTPGNETCTLRMRSLVEHREQRDSKKQRRVWRQTLRSAAFPSWDFMPDPVASPSLPDSA
ncbi:unnamed protein product [Larinioides sclopetarius]|uniref:Reverse transcriptase domain-containing protein n=1 Tax=Larinioides sclopetarius TaxID=280406 RepID=A0AAV2AKP2_9ARAC